MADQYVINRSMMENDTVFDLQNSQMAWINDSNNGSYTSSQITFDCSTFANSGRYWDMKSSYLTIPLVMTLQASATQLGGTKENAFAMSLKSNLVNLFNSMSITLTNNEVITNQSFSNIVANYRILSSFSSADVENWGATLHFEKDTAQSQSWNGVAGTSGSGIGISNNAISGVAGNNVNNNIPTTGNQLSHNVGRSKRMLHTSWNANDTTMNATGAISNVAIMPSASTISQVGKNQVIQNSTSLITYHILATVPLKFLHDFFDKMPLMKNAYFRMVFSMNVPCSSVITHGATGLITACSTTSQFGQCPFQVSPISSTAGTGCVISALGTLTAKIGIASVAGSTAHPISSCRLYGRMVEFTPMYEALYLKDPVKTVKYEDIFTFNNILNVASGASVNQILSSSIARLRKIYIFPFYNASANGGLSPVNSPFSSEPSTCSPYAYVSNYNIALSGVPIYNESQTYRFHNFLTESKGINSINGGLQNGLSVGLLNETDYSTTYGVLVSDLSRHDASQDDIAKSVMVQFSNLSSLNMDYIVAIAYEREIHLNVEAGSLVI